MPKQMSVHITVRINIPQIKLYSPISHLFSLAYAAAFHYISNKIINLISSILFAAF